MYDLTDYKTKEATNNGDDNITITCLHCGRSLAASNFIPINENKRPKAFIHYSPICDECIEKLAADEDTDFQTLDRICQILDLPYLPKELNRLDNNFRVYAKIYQEGEYQKFGWQDYFEEFQELKKQQLIAAELPLLAEERHRKLRATWGPQYDLEELETLNDLLEGILLTQNVNGALQLDQARKVCKISLEIDKKLMAGEPIDKLSTSMANFVKQADFTPKNTKDSNDFSTFGEVAKWLETRGFINTFYDNTPKDVVDESIRNLEAFNRRLYLTEANMGETITARIEALNQAAGSSEQKTLDSIYGLESFTDEELDERSEEALEIFDMDDSSGADAAGRNI